MWGGGAPGSLGTWAPHRDRGVGDSTAELSGGGRPGGRWGLGGGSRDSLFTLGVSVLPDFLQQVGVTFIMKRLKTIKKRSSPLWVNDNRQEQRFAYRMQNVHNRKNLETT